MNGAQPAVLRAGAVAGGTPRVRALALHAEFCCQGAGACRTSGWEIPIEPDVEDRLRVALRSGALGLPAAAGDRASAGPQRFDEAACLPSAEGLPHGARALRGCAEAERALDEELLREAFRRADLLLLHFADPDAFARRLSRCERSQTAGSRTAPELGLD